MSELDALLRRLEVLEIEQSQIREDLESVKSERDIYHELYQQALERCRKLELGLRGQTSERLPNEAQLSFDVLRMMLAEDGRTDLSELEEPQVVHTHKRRRPTGRKPLPEHLPRVEIEILPDIVKREGLDAFDKIGEDVTEVIERRPASLVVARVVKPKFVRKNRARRNGDIHVGTPLSFRFREAQPGLECWLIRSFVVGRIISRCIGWSRSTAEMASSCRGKPSAIGTCSWFPSWSL